MKSLENIFDKENEIQTARKILKIVEDSPFSKKDVGVPIFAIQVRLGIDEDYIKGIVSQMVEFKYLTYHGNSTRGNPKICLDR